jgi:hypothetical protein
MHLLWVVGLVVVPPLVGVDDETRNWRGRGQLVYWREMLGHW